MPNKMLIDATHPEETRVVVVRGNRVEEFDFEAANRRQLRGNIYLAKVTRVEPSLQAAFVEYGGNRHGFLAFSEIHPDYYQIPVADRQALIEEEERAHRESDDDEPRGNGHRRRSAEGHRHRRRSAPVQGEPGPGEPGAEADLDRPEGDAPNVDLAQAEPEAGTETSSHSAQASFPGASSGADENPRWAAELAPSGQSAASPPAEGSHSSAEAPRAPSESFARFSEGTTSGAAQEHMARTENTDNAPGGDSTDHLLSTAAETEFVQDGQARPHDDHDDDEDDENGHEEEEVVESVGGADALEEAQERLPRYRRHYKIQEVIKRRQVMLVQVVKEERGTKGAALTTYLSLAGRYSVLMPNTARGGGISRKITSAADRKRLKDIAQELEVPEGMGVILRTAGANRTKAEVKRDFEYLMRLWETVRDLTLRSSAPMLVYEEGSLIKRSIRDLYSKDIDEIVVAGETGHREAKDFMRMLMPSHAKNVKLYRDPQPLFTRHGIESQLDAMFSPVVQLKSGGYIVINQAEALVAIDVNSGRATREHHIEDTALKTNLEAAEEVARQLRLRDLAGLIVIDFIDMDEKRNNRSVERKLKDCLKNERARIQVGRISHFGLLEMSRQRIRTGVLESSTEKCPHCGGAGHVRSISSVTLQMLRSLEETLLKGAQHNVIIRTRSDVALYVLNHKRAHLRELETRFQITVTVNADAAVNGQQSFVIERGEQVHTPEAARAIAQRWDSARLPPEEIEEEADLEAEDFDDEADEELMEADPADLADAEVDAESPENEEPTESGDSEESGVRRRRRRRRRRRPGEASPAEAGGETAPTESAAEADDDEDAETGDEPASAGAPPEANGDAERRRKRRGRRGGRRNRRDSEGDSAPERTEQQGDAVAGWQDWAQAPQADAVEPPIATQEPAFRPEPPALEPVFQASQPTLEPARAPVAAPPTTETEQRPPRRRSTIREPAPVFAGASSAMPAEDAVGIAQASVMAETPSAATGAESAPAAVEESAAHQDKRSRRTGWWARRVFGKE
jgi:ribonuclease E